MKTLRLERNVEPGEEAGEEEVGVHEALEGRAAGDPAAVVDI